MPEKPAKRSNGHDVARQTAPGRSERPVVALSRITEQPLDAGGLLDLVRSPLAGAAVLFVGSVREFTTTDEQTRQTIRLSYEAYVPMAEAEMRSILEAAASEHGLVRAAAEHRIGDLELGDLAVVVAVSSGHREASFEAGREILEQIKSRVPIWKKEHWSSGVSQWMHPDAGRPKQLAHAGKAEIR